MMLADVHRVSVKLIWDGELHGEATFGLVLEHEEWCSC
jgi:hypothetical protein